MKVAARCVSDYDVSPDSLWSVPVPWSTTVPTPATPTVSVPASQYAGYRFTVSIGGSTCPSGTTTRYDVWTSGSGTHWPAASFSDYWSNAGTYTYYAQIWCHGIDNDGARSGTGSDSISIVNPPVPAAPSGCGIRQFIMTSNSRAINELWGQCSASSYASSYEGGARWQTVNSGWSFWSSVSTSGPSGFGLRCTGDDGSTVTSQQLRVRAINARGSSGYSMWSPSTSSANRVVNACF